MILTISSILFLAYFILLIIFERLFPLRRQKHNYIHRLLLNLSLAAFMLTIAVLVVRPVALVTIAWSDQFHFGILYLLPLNNALKFVIGFLLMDLTFYYWHRMNHRIPLLWRFHVVHHIDTDLDVSTALRFHYVEVLYSALFRLLQLGIIGVNPILFFSYEIIFQGNTLLQHSNIRLPIRFERTLNKIFVTPRMHGIHHSQVRNETNANYSVVFSFWDRLHKTLRLNIPQQKVDIGIPAYTQAQDNRLWFLLIHPFQYQKDAWQNAIKRNYFTREKSLLHGKVSQLAE